MTKQGRRWNNSAKHIWIGLALLFPAFAFAETLVLKNGQSVEGEILEKTNEYVKIKFQGLGITYSSDEIKAINGNPISATHSNKVTLSYEQMAADAEKESRELLEKNPDSAMAYVVRGMARRMNGDKEGSINYFNKAIEINPDCAEAYHNRGLSYASREVGKYRLAIADFSKAIEKNPQDGDSYFMRALSYFEISQYDQAWEDSQKAKSLGLEYYAKLYPEFIVELKKAMEKK